MRVSSVGTPRGRSETQSRPLHSAHKRRPNSPRLLVWTVPRRATSRIGTIGQRPVKTAPAPLRVLPRCKNSECGHLQTPYGPPFHSELGAHGWSRYGAPGSQPVATSGKSTGSQTRRNKPNRLPPAATSCARRSMVSRASAVGCHPLLEVPSLRRRGSTLTWLVSARLFLRAIRARALVAAAAGASLADHGEMILTDSSRGPSAAVLEARLRRSRRGGDGPFPDAHVRRRFVEVEIAAAPGPTPQAKEVERADEPPNAITPAGACGPQLHCAAASASASVR